jgi:DNA-binding LacI/PurR family transcriptional regulator
MSKRPIPTIRDVAREAGVSVATVSRYINGTAVVSREVSVRLDAVMRELKYVPHAAARQLASRKTRLLGLVVSNLRNDFYVPLLNGIEVVMRHRGYNLMVATYHLDGRQDSPSPIGPYNADGLLVFADGLGDEDLRHFHEVGFPMVLMHRRSPEGIDIPAVTVENVESTGCLLEHLIQVHGRRRIVFLRGPRDQEDAHLREEAYHAALRAHGIPYDERLILSGDFDRIVAYQSMSEFLGSESRVGFDAVFAGSDDAATGVYLALQQHQMRIPEDISVVGFDDLGFARYLDPPLTTVRAPTERVGELATERLFSLLENQDADLLVVLPTEVIIRRSCGCPCEQQAL